MDEIQSPDTETTVAEPTTDAPEASAPTDTLEVKFNKQQVTLSRDDAIRYAQKGMKYDNVLPLLDTLRDVAMRRGVSLADLVESLGGEETPAQTPTPTLTDRLAEEYLILCREVPDVGAFDALPPEALREAAEDGISLLDAYLRHRHREACRVANEQAAAAAAAKAALGTQASATEHTSPVVAAMMRGLWGR